MFAGVGGSLNVAHNDVNNGTIGFAANAVSLSLVTAQGALTDPVLVNRGDSYVGVSVAITDAQLIGVNGLSLYAGGTVKLNKAVDVTSVALATRMNWTVATAIGNDPSNLLADLTIGQAVSLSLIHI